MVFFTPLTTLVSLSGLFALTSAVVVQKDLLQLPADATQNRQTVKDMFLYSYNAYKSVFLHNAGAARLITVITGVMRGTTMT
jgi:hypothetical protein